MFLWESRPYRNTRAYTLVEIAITCILVGVIASMAIPNFSTTTEKSRASEGVQILSSIWQAQQLYALENDSAVAGALTDLDVEIPAPPKNFIAPVLYTTNGHTAYIDQDNADYRLYIENDNDITCDDTPGIAGICAKMGFAAYPF